MNKHRRSRNVIGRTGGPGALLILFIFFATACGGGGDSGGGDAAVPAAGGSPLNAGPPAVETMTLNPGLADWGAQVFEKRACITCHAVGERKQGPDLAGVASRRTEAWLSKQITDPEWMLKNDPIARELMAEYALQMADQQVPEQEVQALIQFFVRESLENPPAVAGQ